MYYDVVMDNQIMSTNVGEEKLSLNTLQCKAVQNMNNFISHEKQHNFLLLGPAGSGKTTVCVNCFSGKPLHVVFCSFTNKAVQQLRSTMKKFGLETLGAQVEFRTIHKMLNLEIRYLSNETEIAFKFDVKKIGHLRDVDILIIDECSIVNKELFQYIADAVQYTLAAHNKQIKCIYLGDFWQLPPIGEEISTVFEQANQSKWSVSKLAKVMRYGSEQNIMHEINNTLLDWIRIFKASTESLTTEEKKKIKKFISEYPYNLVQEEYQFQNLPTVMPYINDIHEFLTHYITRWKDEKQEDICILTHTNRNCDKTNYSIQDMLDMRADRIPVDRPEIGSIEQYKFWIKFHVGDRCCIAQPIECVVFEKKPISTLIEPGVVEIKNPNQEVHQIKSMSGEMLYNGEIFDILDVQDTFVYTALNTHCKDIPFFDAQLLTVKRIGQPEQYQIMNLNPEQIDHAKKAIYKKYYRRNKQIYMQIMTGFLKIFPRLQYGYCITTYKSQGSEYTEVMINLCSIKWAVAGNDEQSTLRVKKKLFRATYTACTRAKQSVTLFWG
jgi:ATP-dependent exoDNAse (exonuclease V) alpha subunit